MPSFWDSLPSPFSCTGGIGEGNGPGYYNLKLGSQAAADTGKQGFKVGREDKGII